MPLERMKLRTFPFSKSIGNMKPSMMTFLPWNARISLGNGSRAPLSLVWGQYRNASFAKVMIIGLSLGGAAAGLGASATGLGSAAGVGLVSAATGLASTTTGFGSGAGWTSTGVGTTT